MTDGIGADLYVQAWVKGTGTGSLNIVIEEYDAADCTTSLQDDAILTTYDTSANWERKGDIVAAATWHADTSSYLVSIEETGDNGVLVQVDAVEAYVGSEPRPGWCGSDTSANTVCTSTVPASTPSPISANGALTIRLSAWSPWAGTEITRTKVITSDGQYYTTNTITAAVSAGYNEPFFYVVNSSAPPGGIRALSPNVADWAAKTQYDLKFYKDPTASLANLGMWWNGGWFETPGAGAADGQRTTAQSTFYLGGDLIPTSAGDMWTWGYKIFRRVKR